MERFPVLDLILRFGTAGAVVLGFAVGLLAIVLSWGALGWIAVALGLVAGGLVFLIGKSYVELVTLITEMLVPR